MNDKETLNLPGCVIPLSPFIMQKNPAFPNGLVFVFALIMGISIGISIGEALESSYND